MGGGRRPARVDGRRSPIRVTEVLIHCRVSELNASGPVPDAADDQILHIPLQVFPKSADQSPPEHSVSQISRSGGVLTGSFGWSQLWSQGTTLMLRPWSRTPDRGCSSRRRASS